MRKIVGLVLSLGFASLLPGCGGSGDEAPAPGAEAAAGPDLSAPEDVATPPPEAEVAASGLSWRVLQPGTGTRRPAPTDTVSVHYIGWQTNGTMFDSSYLRGRPLELSLEQVIAGWREGLPMMVEGERRRFWIPEALAYRGEEGFPSGMLVFDVELLAIVGS